MPRTIAKKDLPFTGKINQFISYYVSTEDLSLAAKKCGLEVEHARRLYARKGIREAIDKRLEVVHEAQAKLVAKYRMVTVEMIDDQLVTAMKKGAQRGDPRALELGYRRMGIFRNGEFIGLDNPNEPVAAGAHPPPIFRVERTVTRTEQVTERAELQSGHPALPAEILQY
jgi:hypothetical protein